MAIFTINEEKCRKDGICAEVCPLGIINIEKNESFPQPAEKAAELCISCGHCTTVCPHGAFQLTAMELSSCPESQVSLQPSPEQLTQLIRNRRSTRVFKPKPVERDRVHQLISLSRYAPTARNSQMLKWMVIDSAEELTSLKSHMIAWMKDLVVKKDPAAIAYDFENIVNGITEDDDPILRNAPGLIIIYAPAIYPYGLIDSTIAMTTFELAASNEGIGTCWAGFFMRAAADWKPLRDALKLPKGHNLTTALMIGYPKFRYSHFPKRQEPDIIWR